MIIEKVSIIGAGAIGTFYGGKLLKAGINVEFYSKSHATLLNKKKITVKSTWGNFSFKANFYNDVHEMQSPNLIIVCTKSLPHLDINKLIKPICSKGAIILLLQNGINQEEKLAKSFSSQVILGGLAFSCINRDKPNIINHLDYGHIKVGPLKKENTKYAKALSKIFNQAGIECTYNSNLKKLRWHKLLWNIPYNPLSVILNTNTKKIMNNKHTANLVKDIMLEVKAIAKSQKVIITIKDINLMLNNTKKMSPYNTSMILDYHAHRKMEVDAILGQALRIAKKNKIAVPKIGMLFEQLSFLS